MLIFDLGVNKGEDTARYLALGASVIGVAANPDLCAGLKEHFRAEIAEGRLTLLNVGIWSDAGELPFYRNKNDHWSSFDPVYGHRGEYETISIKTITFDHL